MNPLKEVQEILMRLQELKPKNFLWSNERLRKKYLYFNNHHYNALRFLCMYHVAQLSELLGYNLSTLEKLINEPRYQVFKIVKKKGGYRTIAAPNPILKKVQSILNFYLQATYLCFKPKSVFGFVLNPKDRLERYNIVANAAQHVSKKQILNIDIEDFFPSITTRQVYELFLSEPFHFPAQLSRCLALLCTYQAKLPTGAPTSPVLSNFICIPMDNELQVLAVEYNCTYSRYADDLSFSSNEEIDTDFECKIYEILRKYGFNSQAKKRRLQKYYQHQNVTGIVVNEKLNVSRKKLKKIRAMLHDATQNGVLNASLKHYGMKDADNPIALTVKFTHYLQSEISFVKFVRGDDFLVQRFEQELHLIQRKGILN